MSNMGKGAGYYLTRSKSPVSYTHLFADEAVVDFYFLLTTSVLALDSFVDGYFFN